MEPTQYKKVVVVLSGGLDSTILLHKLHSELGESAVVALSFNYGQIQGVELEHAKNTCEKLNIKHKVIDISFLGNIVSPICANIANSEVEMPTISDVLGDPQPPTYVPYRNMILNSIAMSFAEVNNCDAIATGLQVHDEYGYWDTSQKFVECMNSVSSLNRTSSATLIAPFAHLSKSDELALLKKLPYDFEEVVKNTITCYNPNNGKSCGTCPSCSERIAAFAKINEVDPIPYDIELDWSILCAQYSEVSA